MMVKTNIIRMQSVHTPVIGQLERFELRSLNAPKAAPFLRQGNCATLPRRTRAASESERWRGSSYERARMATRARWLDAARKARPFPFRKSRSNSNNNFETGDSSRLRVSNATENEEKRLALLRECKIIRYRSACSNGLRS